MYVFRRGLWASSEAFSPKPVTCAYPTSGGKWLIQLLIRSRTRPPAGR